MRVPRPCSLAGALLWLSVLALAKVQAAPTPAPLVEEVSELEGDGHFDSDERIPVDEQGKYPSTADYPKAVPYDGPNPPDDFDSSTVPIVGGGILKNVMDGGDGGGDEGSGDGETAPFMNDKDPPEPDFKFTDQYKDNPWREVPPDATKQSVEATSETSSVDTTGSESRSLLGYGLALAAGAALLAGYTYRQYRAPSEEDEEERDSMLPAQPRAYGATAAPPAFAPCQTGTCEVLDLGAGAGDFHQSRGAPDNAEEHGHGLLQHITPRRGQVGLERSAL